MDVTDLQAIDLAMIELDGTENKSQPRRQRHHGGLLRRGQGRGHRQGRSSCTSTCGKGSHVLPGPMMNVINGGKHAGGNLKIQEFMISPCGAKPSPRRCGIGAEVYQSLKTVLKDAYGAGAINVGDEGGFAPPLNTAREALDMLVKAIEAAGYVPGKDVYLAMDAGGQRVLSRTANMTSMARGSVPVEMVDFYAGSGKDYPLISLEDPFEEEAFDTMAELTKDDGQASCRSWATTSSSPTRRRCAEAVPWRGRERHSC